MRRLALGDLLRSPSEIAELARILGRGGVIALPTETFYALAADPRSDAGVSRIFEIKGRDDGKPLLVLFSNRGQLDALGVSARPDLVDRFFDLWPAPLTVVLALRAPIAASRGARALGVRMPAAPRLRELLDVLGPVTGTSANPSGAPALASPASVGEAFEGTIDVLVDGGATAGGQPSTVVDATREPVDVLRPGAFPWSPESR